MSGKKVNIQLGDRIIYPDSKPYIIAEIGVNHNGDLILAKKLIDAGADVLVAGSYIYEGDESEYKNLINSIR